MKLTSTKLRVTQACETFVQSPELGRKMPGRWYRCSVFSKNICQFYFILPLLLRPFTYELLLAETMSAVDGAVSL
jgi:hypothetical protein